MDKRVVRLHEIKEGKGSRIINSFIMSTKYQSLFKQVLEDPSESNLKKLDEAFKEFFYEVKLTKYMLTLIHNYAIQTIKRYRIHFEKQLYILDQESSENEGNSNLLDYIAQDYDGASEKLYEAHIHSILDCIENPELYYGLKKLNNKQLNVLYLIYVKNYKIKEVAELYNDSNQNISKTHKKTLLMLYKEVANKNEHN